MPYFFFTGIDLENILYYKDNTHYFVMTPKKQSLLDKGVIIHVSSGISSLSHNTTTQSALSVLCVFELSIECH